MDAVGLVPWGGWTGGSRILAGLAYTLALATGVWLASLWRRDLSLIDRWWGPLVAGSGLTVLAVSAKPPLSSAAWGWTLAACVLAGVWALRLAVYLSWRNWGQGEDRRYTRLREAGGPSYAYTSLVRVFMLQALLGWVISSPLMALVHTALEGPGQPVSTWAAGLALAVASLGLLIESVADAQMASHRRARARQPAATAASSVMDRGLWRYSRHPNYFGETCFWWGLGALAVAVGGASAAWALLGPALLTFLLLKVSGAPMLEADLGARSPAYREYIARTPAFFPGRPRTLEPVRAGLEASPPSTHRPRSPAP